jgi:hypothetical protein
LRRALRDRLMQVPDLVLDESALERRPSIPLRLLANDNAEQAFLAAYDWVLDTILKKERACSTTPSP